jgi:Transposase DDE domain
MANKRLVESKVLSCVSGNAFMVQKAKIELTKMDDNSKIFIPLDGSEIRKQWTTQSEMLDRVRGLDGKIINGYHSYCTVAVREDNHEIHLLEHNIYSTKTQDFLSKNDETMKIIDSTLLGLADLPNQKVFLFDREFDNLKIIEHLANHKQKPSFVIRAKHLNRGVEVADFELADKRVKANEIAQVKKQIKDQIKDQVKIQDLEFKKKNQSTFKIQKLKIKQKTHFDLTLKLFWEDVKMTSDKGEKTIVKVIKSQLTDRNNQPIFKFKKGDSKEQNKEKNKEKNKEQNKEIDQTKPQNKEKNSKIQDTDSDFYLLTNQEINNPQEAFQIYLSYFIRWKIETVFKFLKDSLGLEEFRVENFTAIKNIISLTFLIGAYLMELGEVDIDDEFLIWLAKLGRGKGAVTKYFLMQGLQELTHYLNVQTFFEQHKIPPQQQQEMLDYVRSKIV